MTESVHRLLTESLSAHLRFEDDILYAELKTSLAQPVFVRDEPDARETQNLTAKSEEPIPTRHEVAAHVAEKEPLSDLRVTRFLLDHAKHPEEIRGMFHEIETGLISGHIVNIDHNPNDFTAYAALRVIAHHTRSRASGYAMVLRMLDTDAPVLSALVASLVLCPNPGDLDRLLDRLKVTPLPKKTFVHAPVTLVEALAQRGRCVVFDSEAGCVPPNHPHLLYALARIVELNHFEFAQEISGDPRSEVDVVVTALYAKADDQVFETPAHAPGDFYDVQSAMGFVNSLAARHGSHWRLSQVGSPDQAVEIVALPADAFRELTDGDVVGTLQLTHHLT
jgi:hypothetical protein